MNRRVIVRAEAEKDIAETALWYNSHEAGLGLSFLAEVQSGIARALRQPNAFALLRRNPIVRRVLTRRFPYRIFFVVRPNAIVVFAVLHAARQDQMWSYRADLE